MPRRTKRHLSTLSGELDRELKEILRSFNASGTHLSIRGFSVDYGAAQDGCVVSAWDAWNRFMRSLILTSCAGTSIGGSGTTYVTRQSYPEHAALARVRKNSKNTSIRFTRSEPNWYSPKAAADYCRILSLPNTAVITGAVTASSIVDATGTAISNPLTTIRIFRNFVAHKNTDTYRDIMAFIPPGVSLLDYLHSKTAGGVSVFDEWVSGITAVATAATQ